MSLLAKTAALVGTLSLAACVQTPAEKAQADIATMQREATVDKLVERGKIFAAMGDGTRAEEYLTAALDAGANPKEVLPVLLSVCVQNGKYRSAILHAEQHLRTHPDDAQTRFVLGTLHAALGEAKEARVELQRAIEARPGEANAHYALAVLARDTENDVVSADRQFREYLRLKPNGEHAEEARASLLKEVP